MKAQLDRLAAKFNALAARERAIVFGGVLLTIIVLSYLMVIEPKLIQKKRLTQQVAEAQKSLQTLQSLKTPSQDPIATRRGERDALRKQLAEIDKTMGQIQRGLVPPERMGRLLEDVLRRSRGLQLVSMRTLPVKRFDPAGGAGGETTLAQDAAERQLYQHTFEMTVQGTYGDLHDYLRMVEQPPWRLFWSRISVSVNPEEHHSKLSITLTVQTLSLSKAWLIV
jgi:MSHA biogenesis protein MshJ